MGKNIKVTIHDTIGVSDSVIAKVHPLKVPFRFWKDHWVWAGINFALSVTMTIVSLFFAMWPGIIAGIVWSFGTCFGPLLFKSVREKYQRK
jgi:hypothetical protein